MREINVEQITQAVKALCIKANKVLPCSLTKLIESSEKNEESPIGQEIFHDLCENLNAAKELDVPICQDTGMAVVFIEIGQEVMLAGGSLEKAINDGVSQGYTQGLLRCSIVEDPLNRVNTGDNTPAVIHTKIVDGDKISLTVAPKGFGSENMSAMKMFTPSATSEDIIDFVVQCVDDAGSNPCPPIVVGVGIGGDFELCAYLSKKALCRDVLSTNENKFY
ncbi:MAG: hypothetical protein K0R90_1563, partial [Oscillospiraceae bacterium]|nr:hypothetical protein [Oscillospiraceae bacterium]